MDAYEEDKKTIAAAKAIIAKTAAICIIEDCNKIGKWQEGDMKFRLAKGLCQSHYHRLRRYGDPEHIKHESHGMHRTPEYRAWEAAVQRCHNKNNPRYKGYGGRGITMNKEWRSSFTAFYKHVGPRPSKKHSLDRIDNEKNYEPGNVEWALRLQQDNNRTNSRLLTHQGKTMTIAEWSRETGIAKNTLKRRKLSGWSDERVVTTPVNKNLSHNKYTTNS